MLKPVRWVGEAIIYTGVLSNKTLGRSAPDTARRRVGRTLWSWRVRRRQAAAAGRPADLRLVAAAARPLAAADVSALWIGAACVIGLLGPDYAVRTQRKRYLRAPGARAAGCARHAGDLRRGGAGAGGGHRPRGRGDRRRRMPPSPRNSCRPRAICASTPTAASRCSTSAAAPGWRRCAGSAGRWCSRCSTARRSSQALRTLSAEMRGEMLTRFEAKAARMPVLLTLPMILFILPCVFMVVAGPAMLQVIRHLR